MIHKLIPVLTATLIAVLGFVPSDCDDWVCKTIEQRWHMSGQLMLNDETDTWSISYHWECKTTEICEEPFVKYVEGVPFCYCKQDNEYCVVSLDDCVPAIATNGAVVRIIYAFEIDIVRNTRSMVPATLCNDGEETIHGSSGGTPVTDSDDWTTGLQGGTDPCWQNSYEACQVLEGLGKVYQMLHCDLFDQADPLMLGECSCAQ